MRSPSQCVASIRANRIPDEVSHIVCNCNVKRLEPRPASFCGECHSGGALLGRGSKDTYLHSVSTSGASASRRKVGFWTMGIDPVFGRRSLSFRLCFATRRLRREGGSRRGLRKLTMDMLFQPCDLTSSSVGPLRKTRISNIDANRPPVRGQ